MADVLPDQTVTSIRTPYTQSAHLQCMLPVIVVEQAEKIYQIFMNTKKIILFIQQYIIFCVSPLNFVAYSYLFLPFYYRIENSKTIIQHNNVHKEWHLISAVKVRLLSSVAVTIK